MRKTPNYLLQEYFKYQNLVLQHVTLEAIYVKTDAPRIPVQSGPNVKKVVYSAGTVIVQVQPITAQFKRTGAHSNFH
jgi:hypothetical protein